jgi:hypothetical protein
MIGTGLRLTRAATPPARARAVSRRMKPTGPRSPRCTAGATRLAGGRTASRGAPTGGTRNGLPARAVALASTGDGAARGGGGTLACGLAWALGFSARMRSLATTVAVVLAIAARGCDREPTGGVAFTGVSVATSLSAVGAGRSTRRAVPTALGGGVTSTGSEARGSAGAGCGAGISAVTAGGGAATGGSGSDEGGAGAGWRAGSRPSGSTYPFGSAATRTPKWTCGCRVTASLLSPTTPTSVPSVRALPRSTLVAPSWSSVTA